MCTYYQNTTDIAHIRRKLLFLFQVVTLSESACSGSSLSLAKSSDPVGYSILGISKLLAKCWVWSSLEKQIFQKHVGIAAAVT